MLSFDAVFFPEADVTVKQGRWLVVVKGWLKQVPPKKWMEQILLIGNYIRNLE
jgi:hypothetical protein